jgi:cytochrome P450
MKDWGVESFRLPAMGRLCGRGFLTTDGKTWEHSRALLKPSFTKQIISDLSRFEVVVEKVLNQLPTDGETVDLAPVLNELVSYLKLMNGSSADVAIVLKHSF